MKLLLCFCYFILLILLLVIFIIKYIIENFISHELCTSILIIVLIYQFNNVWIINRELSRRIAVITKELKIIKQLTLLQIHN